ncbi:MAG TPA: helix-turn-helix domain-containing protein [Candidatus Saccharimonadales bacterium]|nr:helix-turn-helix domain-containing protein [Candidatus Saccharimonadales bacterium]
MLIDIEAIRQYFTKLGLDSEIADIYLALHTHGPQTISELSRSSKIERTRIYRVLDKLLASNLIEVESHYKRGIIKAAPIANLHILIAQKEQEVKALHDELGLIEQVLARNSLSNPATRVQFYHGKEGIRQMQWNQTRSKTELLSVLDEPISETVGQAFLLRWAETINQREIHMKLLVTSHFDEVDDRWHREHRENEYMPNIEKRLVDPATFHIPSNIDIWEDVVAYYNWKDGDVFGVEIYNQDIADMQRQFFEMLWAKAMPQERHKVIR